MSKNAGLRAATALALGLAAATALASEGASEPLVGDRPDFTESALTIARAHVQLEAGLSYGTADAGDEASLGEVLVRIGLARRWELRLGVGSFARAESGSTAETGWEDPSIEAKVRLDRDPEGPTIALLFGSAVPAGAKAIGAAEAQPFLKLLAQGEFSNRLGLAGNAGYARGSETGGSEFDQVSASLSLGIGLGGGWGSFVEVYGFNREEPGGSEASYADAGVTWLVTRNLQLDARLGTGLAGNDVALFGGVGIVRRW